MKRFMLLHFGFEKPTPEIMAAWGKWFESVADKTVDPGGHFSSAREISHSGTRDLPLGMESITGYTIIHKHNLKLSFGGFVKQALPFAVVQIVMALAYVLLVLPAFG